MIAPELLPYEVRPRTGSRAGRSAATRRRARSRRLRYATLVRIVACVSLAAAVVTAYLGLMANVTRMTYAIGKAEAKRTALLDETARYEDTIARLESRERLAALAAGLRMTDPASFASVTVPPPPSQDRATGVAFLSSVGSWLR